jgi:anti-sigma factor RsiW
MADKLTCKELVELVTDYFEGQLPASEQARFEAHLATCRGCQNYLEQMRQTLRLLGKLSEDGVSPEAQRELLEVFRNWKKGVG